MITYWAYGSGAFVQFLIEVSKAENSVFVHNSVPLHVACQILAGERQRSQASNNHLGNRGHVYFSPVYCMIAVSVVRRA